MKPGDMYTDLQEVPKHRKPGKRVSDSKKRSDHKHVYEPSISVFMNSVNGAVTTIKSTEHCKICGRYNHDLTWWWSDRENHCITLPDGSTRLMTVYELVDTYPGMPIYTNGLEPNHINVDIRLA